jgi:DNA-binding IclR family transcriptional regulator
MNHHHARHAPPTSPAARPVAGPTFRAVARLNPGGPTRRKLLALVAAFQDGGTPSVSRAELADRLKARPGKVQALLERLRTDGYLTRTGSGRWRLSDDLLNPDPETNR